MVMSYGTEGITDKLEAQTGRNVWLEFGTRVEDNLFKVKVVVLPPLEARIIPTSQWLEVAQITDLDIDSDDRRVRIRTTCGGIRSHRNRVDAAG